MNEVKRNLYNKVKFLFQRDLLKKTRKYENPCKVAKLDAAAVYGKPSRCGMLSTASDL
jgi:hypothetical protein